jgi:hypothetical protein
MTFLFSFLSGIGNFLITAATIFIVVALIGAKVLLWIVACSVAAAIVIAVVASKGASGARPRSTLQ